MDIFTLISEDHGYIQDLLEQICLINPRNHEYKIASFMKLREAVIAHNEAEDGTLYIALNAYPATKETAKLLYNEHEEINAAMSALSNAALTPHEWRKKFSQFRHMLLAHIANEENKVFTEAHHVISPEMAQELRISMEEMKYIKQELFHKAS